MLLFRNVYKEWLELYSIAFIYELLDKQGNYNRWKKNFQNALKDELNHPLTIVLLQKMSISELCDKLQPEFAKYHGEHGASLGNWIYKNLQYYENE